MLVGELHRWGMPKERLAPLMPHVDRALAWILEYGDRDGDGFVEYKRANDAGLHNHRLEGDGRLDLLCRRPVRLGADSAV